MRFQRDIEDGGGNGNYSDNDTTDIKPEETKQSKKYSKWFEIWFIVILMIITSIMLFNNDPEFAGYCLGGALMLPLLSWYFDN